MEISGWAVIGSIVGAVPMDITETYAAKRWHHQRRQHQQLGTTVSIIDTGSPIDPQSPRNARQ
jgi:hypothetical protein